MMQVSRCCPCSTYSGAQAAFQKPIFTQSANSAGITGGVEAMHQFAASYFPSTVNAPNTDFYCKYNDRTLAAYSAIMHFTGAVASLPASWFTQHWGRTR